MKLTELYLCSSAWATKYGWARAFGKVKLAGRSRASWIRLEQISRIQLAQAIHLDKC